MIKDEEELIESLRRSRGKVGPLIPIFEDAHGEIIDGFHRLEADENWPRVRLDHVKTRKDRIIARIACNIIRKESPHEKTKLLEEFGEILLEEGVKPGEISKRIAEETGMSYRWVMKYLPDRFKDDSQSERASSAARCAATKVRKMLDFLRPPSTKLVTVNRYGNSDRLHVIFERPLYEGVTELLENLNTTPFLQNVIERHMRELRSLKEEEVEMLRELLKKDVLESPKVE